MIELKLKVKQVTLLINGTGEDTISLILDEPSTHPEMLYDAYAKINVRKGYGLKWLKETYPDVVGQIEVIDISNGRVTIE